MKHKDDLNNVLHCLRGKFVSEAEEMRALGTIYDMLDAPHQIESDGVMYVREDLVSDEGAAKKLHWDIQEGDRFSYAHSETSVGLYEISKNPNEFFHLVIRDGLSDEKLVLFKGHDQGGFEALKIFAERDFAARMELLK